MTTTEAPANELLVTVKAREVQRGMLAEMRGDQTGVRRHFLAAAHLEIVLASDYADAGRVDLSLRSRLSAANCFWRAGDVDRARGILAELSREGPDRAAAAQQVLAELAGASTA
jgi:hypothetical protein